jgi:phosphohistidine swiveling domain-containing protein
VRPAVSDRAGFRAGIYGLDDERALDAMLAGAKAANLARATRAGLPVLPGFVITGATSGPPHGNPVAAADLVVAWADLSASGSRPLVVRSSSAVEDTSSSSMAGLFTSVVDVKGWTTFVTAVRRVLDSGRSLTVSRLADPAAAPMGVLVQPFLQPAKGGVMFGADPITGRHNRLVVAAVRGGPQRLVHGEVAGSSWTLSSHGRVIRHQPGVEGAELSLSERRALARLARRTRRLFGEPQDVEWAIDDGGKLWLLQSRPITSLAETHRGRGPLLGPSPVAETFPDALAPLEDELWVEPLREGLAEALVLAGVASRSRVERSPVVTTVGGRVAADLVLLGDEPKRHALLSRLDPRGPMRRLLAAWRVGRLRSALPALARDLVTRADAQLEAVPQVTTLTGPELLSVLRRSKQALRALHGYEVLMGLLVPPRAEGVTGASMALRLLAAGRAEGLSDEAIVARHPITVVLSPPAIGKPVRFPPVSDAIPPASSEGDEMAMLREALRARARWVQELSARAAHEIGRRLADRAALDDSADVRFLTLSELEAAVFTACAPDDLAVRAARLEGAPLPPRFRLSQTGAVVPMRERRARGRQADTSAGVGAGGGRRAGAVYHEGNGTVPSGSVLIVRYLEPHLASVLPGLAGVVAENGSPLSHLAILAREFGVPVVVGVEDALERFAEGTVVVVDGATGEVRPVEPLPQEEVS